MAIDNRYSSPGWFPDPSGRYQLRYFGIYRDVVPLPSRGMPLILLPNLSRGGGGARRVNFGGATISGHAGVHRQTVNLGTARGNARRVLCVLSTVAALMAAGAGAVGAPGAVAASAPQIHVKLLPSRTTIGSRVAASITATLPAGDHFAKGSLSWGDGSTAAKLTARPVTLHHRYRAPGKYTLVARVTDSHGTRVRATVTETVIATPGSYSGTYSPSPSYVYPLSFYVGADPVQVQDVRTDVNVTCVPGGRSYPTSFVIDSIALGVNGGFHTTSTQSGMVLGSPATIADNVTGRVTGLNTQGQIQASGTLSVRVSYNHATAHTCISGRLPWKVFRDSQPTPQPTARPTAGSYTGGYSVPGGITPFTGYVSADRTQLQDISSAVSVECTPGGHAIDVNYVIDALPIANNGSFAVKTSRQVVYTGTTATLTLTLHGHFHGVNANGVWRAAGSLTAKLTYDNGTAYTCTSNRRSFTLVRDSQPTRQPSGPPPAGDYTGYYVVPGGVSPLSFSVVTGPTTIQSFTTSVTAYCTPGNGSGPVTIALDSVPVKADGSFTSKTSSAGLFNGNAATIDITVIGHTHGVDNQGHPRLAGSLVSTVSYTNGATYSCSSGLMHWSATGTQT